MSLPQGRLQPARAVRVLHRVGRRLAPGGVRHPGPPRRRPPRDHPRGPAGRAAGPLGLRLRGPRGEPVRLLHARHRDAPRRARRVRGCRAGGTSGRRGGAARPPVPLHRLAVDRRGRLPRPRGRRPAPHEGRRAGCGPARRPRRTPRVLAGPSGGAGTPVLGARRRARQRRLRRRYRATRCAGPARRRRPSGAVGARRRAPAGAASRAATARCRSPTRSSCPRANGHSRCGPPGSNPPMSSPTPAGVGPASTPPHRSPTEGLSEASNAARCPPAPGSWWQRRGRPSACCGSARTWCGAGPSAHRWPSACAPTAPARSAWAGHRVRPTSGRW